MRRYTIAFAAILVAGLGAAPALAQKDYNFDRSSKVGRDVTGAIGNATGRRMCGGRGAAARACGEAMERSTNEVYDRSRRFANERGEQLQDFGRNARRRWEERRPRR